MELSTPQHATCLSTARSGHTLEVPERIPKAVLGRFGAGTTAGGETEEPSAQQACGVSFPIPKRTAQSNTITRQRKSGVWDQPTLSFEKIPCPRTELSLEWKPQAKMLGFPLQPG